MKRLDFLKLSTLGAGSLLLLNSTDVISDPKIIQHVNPTLAELIRIEGVIITFSKTGIKVFQEAESIWMNIEIPKGVLTEYYKFPELPTLFEFSREGTIIDNTRYVTRLECLFQSKQEVVDTFKNIKANTPSTLETMILRGMCNDVTAYMSPKSNLPIIKLKFVSTAERFDTYINGGSFLDDYWEGSVVKHCHKHV
jgi:hypothetical protein